MVYKYGLVAASVKPAVLQTFYKDLSGDSSAASNLDEAEIDRRVQLILDMVPEDSYTLIDLRALNSSKNEQILMFSVNIVLEFLKNLLVLQLL